MNFEPRDCDDGCVGTGKINFHSRERDVECEPLIRKPVVSLLSLTIDGDVELATRIERDLLNSTYTITCRVCQNQIDVNNKQDQFVVKCDYCSEATPIQNAPKGKKYVRCKCNCLLVCKASSQRIACPRPDCKRLITLRNSQSNLQSYKRPGMSQIVCGHCKQMFLFNTLQNALVRCPHCRKVSSVGRQFARARGTFYLLVAILVSIVGLTAFLVSGKSSQHPTLLVLHFILFAVFVLVLINSLYYCTMKVSFVENEPI